jgi:hypothetical protein
LKICRAQTADKNEIIEIMKTKMIMTMMLAAVLGAGTLWLAAPQRLNATETNAPSRTILYYTCLMHPNVKADKPGDCPQCGMTLRPVFKTDRSTNAPAITTTNRPVAARPGCCSPGGCCR